MARLALTPDQKKLFTKLGFEVQKTRAKYYPTFIKQGHVLVEIGTDECFYSDRDLDRNYEKTFMYIRTMRNKYGCTPVRIPIKEATGKNIARRLLNAKKASETDENTDLKYLLKKDKELVAKLMNCLTTPNPKGGNK